eukprot:m.20002 g.20002  ORF g.20002 m.20002 type:complete len:380 (+) comp12003_c0_seq3:181-1320(+)
MENCNRHHASSCNAENDGSASFSNQSQLNIRQLNLLACGCQGCHIVDKKTDWIIGERPIDRVGAATHSDDEDESDALVQVEVYMMPSERSLSKKARKTGERVVLSVSNFAAEKRAVYISAKNSSRFASERQASANMSFSNKHEKQLSLGKTLIPTDGNNDELREVPCVTFVCCIDPGRALDLVTYPKHQEIEISKLSFELINHPTAHDPTVAQFDQFPLGGDGPYLCTQGIGGRLTHFYPESYHAFDLRCPEGTPILALADGKVVEIAQSEEISGIHCNNLTQWNVVSIQVANGIQIDYVHIAPGSCSHKIGDFVEKGDVLCLSGKIGMLLLLECLVAHHHPCYCCCCYCLRCWFFLFVIEICCSFCQWSLCGRVSHHC